MNRKSRLFVVCLHRVFPTSIDRNRWSYHTARRYPNELFRKCQKSAIYRCFFASNGCCRYLIKCCHFRNAKNQHYPRFAFGSTDTKAAGLRAWEDVYILTGTRSYQAFLSGSTGTKTAKLRSTRSLMPRIWKTGLETLERKILEEDLSRH